MLCYVTIVAESVPVDRIKGLMYVLVASFIYDFWAVFMFYEVHFISLIKSNYRTT